MSARDEYEMAARLICKQCGKAVQRGYVNALGAVWHPEHFVCAACGLPIDSTSFNVHENKPYHPACYIEQVALRCVWKALDGSLYDRGRQVLSCRLLSQLRCAALCLLQRAVDGRVHGRSL